MPSRPQPAPGQWLQTASVGLALGLLAVLAGLLLLTREADQSRAAHELAGHASEVRADLALHLGGDSRLLADLAQRVGDAPLDQAGFSREAHAIMADHPGIVRISWYGPDHARVWSVAPRHGGGPLAETIATVQRAAAAGEAYSAPFHLPEGPGFVVAVAAQGPRGPRGFVTAGYVAEELLRHVHPVPSREHDVALLGPRGELLAGRREALELQSSVPLDPPGNGIQVLVARSHAPVRVVTLALAGAAALLAFGLALNLRALRRQLQARFEAETVARESEARFREVADTAPVLIWMAGTDAKCSFFNRPWLEFRGRTLAQEEGDGWAEGVHPEDFERCLATYLGAFEARRPFKMEYRLRRQDGEYRWILDHGVPRHDAAGRFLGYIGSCIDITERRQLESELGRARFALDHAGDPVLWVDAAGRYVEVNEAACRHFGRSREELLALAVPDVDPVFSIERWRSHYAELVERGSLTFETVHRRGDGSDVEVEITVSHLVHGGQEHNCAFVRDISARKREERRLAESERRLRTMVDNLPAGAVLVEGGRFHLNRAAEEITGFRSDELPTAESWFRAVHGQRADEMRAAFEADRAAGFPATRVLDVCRKDGQARRIEVAGHASPEGDVVLLHDVTDREQALAAQRDGALQQQAMLATTGDGFWLADLEGRLLEVNETYCRTSGYSRDELLALRIADLDANEEPDEVAGHIRTVMTRGWDRFESRHRRKDGSLFSVEVSVTFVEALSRLICFVRDITERQRAAQALRESEERHRVFLDNFQGLAWQTGLGGGPPDFVRGRVADLTGHEAEELTSGRLSWDTVVVPEDRPRREAALLALRTGEQAVCTVDYRIRRRDGLVRWVEELALLVRRGAGQQVLQAAIYDVSGHKQAQLREQHSREVLELLARGAPLSEVLEGIARAVEAERPGSLCSILLLDAEGRRLLHGAAPSLPGYYNDAIDGLEIGEGVGSCGTAAATGRRVTTEDVAVHPHWQAFRELTRRAGLRSCWSEPVVSAAGEVLGTFAVYRRRPRVPDPDEIRAVESAARFAAIAIERTRADQALRESEASLARLVERLAEANRVLAGVAGSQGRFISGDTPAGVHHEVVAALVDLTASARGILCEVRRQPDGGLALESLAECGPGWEAGPAEAGGGGALQALLEGLLGHEGPLIVDDVGRDARLAGRLAVAPLPPSFLGLPVRRGSELLGLLGLAGRWGGYSDEMLPDVEPLVTTAATLIEAERATRLHAAAEAERREALERALASERRLTESQQAVRQAASEWVATFDAVEFAILVVDAEGRVVRLNRTAARMAAADWGSCVGRPLGEIGPGEPWRTAAFRARAGGPEGSVGVRDVAGRSWEVSLTLAAGRDGGPDRTIVVIHDVTNLVELRESVKRSETMAAMGSLVAGVAHEVRNPLFAMSVNIDALALELQGLPEIHELVDALRSERDRISRIMEDLLHFGRPTPARRRPGALEPVLARALQACAAHASRAGVGLERTGSAAGLRLLLDPDRLEEVFQNLLDNACQHAPEGSLVVLEARPLAPVGEAAWVEVQVRDSGAGFPSDLLPQVFQPFVTRRKGGIGLGLAIVQRIVDEHGGRVSAANAPGGGAVVTVELPLLAPA